MYIVIEGQDGTGKSTQVEKLADYFRVQGKSVVTFHEPDGELVFTHNLRNIIKDKSYNLNPLTHVFLFMAARVELWTKLAEPVLAQGGVVISARNWWSTLAYQGYGQGVSRNQIISLVQEYMPATYFQPTKAVILTLDNDERLRRERLRDGNSSNDAFESKTNDFQTIVNNAYLSIVKDFHIPTLDTAASVEEIFTAIKHLLQI